jgi:hypothetical protein
MNREYALVLRLHAVSRNYDGRSLCGLTIAEGDRYATPEAGRRMWNAGLLPRCCRCETAMAATEVSTKRKVT